MAVEAVGKRASRSELFCVNATRALLARALRSGANHKEKITMKKFVCAVVLCGIAAVPAFAQGGAAPAAGAPQAPSAVTADPLAAFVKGAFNQISRNLIGSAEQMLEANYNMKIGTMPEVRKFGELIGHVINANYLFCAQVKGESSPQTVDYEKTPQTKDQLVRAMHEAIFYCSSVYDALTDAAAMQMITPPAGPAGPARAQLRVAILMRNVGHNNEEYGNLVGYFRAANLVPPSTAAANAAAAGRRGN
jgi:DinB family protein